MRYPSVFFFYLSTLSYLVTFVLYLLHAVLKNSSHPVSLADKGREPRLGIVASGAAGSLSSIDWGRWATRSLIVSLVFSTLGVLFRSIELGNASQWVKAFFLPLSTTYETLTFFSWLIPLVYLWVERKFGVKQIGVFVTGAAFVMLSVAASPSFAPSAPTGVPASLQSYWLTTHVLFMVIGIAFFTSGFGATLVYLWRRYQKKLFLLFGALLGVIGGIIFGVIPLFATLQPLKMAASVALLIALGAGFGWLLLFVHRREHQPVSWEYLENIEEIVYRCNAIGFPFYAIGGLVFGGIWAEQAWSRYWGWDPKETAMLVTALVYAVYLHARLTWGNRDPGWRGGLVGWLSVLGYFAVLYAWIGINYFVASLHSFV
ncbi:MAG: cytochrome c biogenesis protein CcsA [Candidatus Bipolaricaulota bacterium]|nr:cytochrome c biogenesis protein CcsA [Candidatus Bipolaricaulota bacterium]MDW8110015.1 cytochrome c biogenesis protein CcsA [Candidatus Bipolaricaulota bacterium]MDW8328913.1 cytochrome c biogenesis protein CcsA [Candidatus Bipolaricaulota bacterium]